MPHYHINNNLNKARGIDGNLDWFIINNLCELVENDEYQVIAVLFPICQNWQTCDKIH